MLLEVNTYLNVKHVVRSISVFGGSQRLTGHHSHNHQIVGQLDLSVPKYKILEPLTAVDASLRSIRCQQEWVDTYGHHWKCFWHFFYGKYFFLMKNTNFWLICPVSTRFGQIDWQGSNIAGIKMARSVEGNIKGWTWHHGTIDVPCMHATPHYPKICPVQSSDMWLWLPIKQGQDYTSTVELEPSQETWRLVI